MLPALAALLIATPLRADEVDRIEKLYRAGQRAEALREVDAALAQRPRDAQMRFLKGLMLLEAQRTDEAVLIFTTLTEEYPELPDPYNNLAVIQASRGQLQSALHLLQTALRNDPKHRAALENLGDVHLALAAQAWTAAQAQAKGDDAVLKTKLRLARELQALPTNAPVARTPG
jgi:Flp pilus assembly protein TadD